MSGKNSEFGLKRGTSNHVARAAQAWSVFRPLFVAKDRSSTGENMSSLVARYFPGLLARPNEVSESETSDEALMLRLQNEDVAALGILYRRYAKLVYSVSSRILRDSAEAEDLVHEVFLSLYRRCRSFDPGKGTARSWLIQLTYHSCFNWRDYLKDRHGHQQGNGESKAAALPESAENRNPADRIIWNPRMKSAFESLSKEQRLTLSLHYFEDYTFKEIAEEMGYSYGNVKHYVYRGMERLRRIVFDGAAGETCRKQD